MPGFQIEAEISAERIAVIDHQTLAILDARMVLAKVSGLFGAMLAAGNIPEQHRAAVKDILADADKVAATPLFPKKGL
jgi:hypothetical protein